MSSWFPTFLTYGEWCSVEMCRLLLNNLSMAATNGVIRNSKRSVRSIKWGWRNAANVSCFLFWFISAWLSSPLSYTFKSICSHPGCDSSTPASSSPISRSKAFSSGSFSWSAGLDSDSCCKVLGST